MHLLKDENGNVIPHGHDHGHCHEEEHCHEKEHCHEHSHCHEHASGHAHESALPDSDKTKALLTYMLQHNESHAAELDKMALRLADEGREEAAGQVRKAVDEFMKGNMYLKLALSSL